MAAGIPVSLPTPCGTFTYVIPLPGITLPKFPPDFSFPFPPKWSIPFPDCSIFEHTGLPSDPPGDSQP